VGDAGLELPPVQRDPQERADVGLRSEMACENQVLGDACLNEQRAKAYSAVLDAAVDDGVREIAAVA